MTDLTANAWRMARVFVCPMPSHVTYEQHNMKCAVVILSAITLCRICIVIANEPHKTYTHEPICEYIDRIIKDTFYVLTQRYEIGEMAHQKPFDIYLDDPRYTLERVDI